MKGLHLPASRVALFVAVLFGFALGAKVASGAEPERAGKVGLAVLSCPEPFEASLRKILAIELGELLDPTPSDQAEARESIEIACEAEFARISARSARGDRVVSNDLRFDAYPGDAAPRAAALAGLEALRAVDPTLNERIEAQRAAARPSAPAVSAASPPAPPPPRTAEPGEERALTRVLAGGVARFFLGEPGTTAFGARLELSRRFSTPWDAGFDLEASFAGKDVNLGTVDALLFSAAGWFGVRAGGARWSGTAAFGSRVGFTELSGDPNDQARGHSVTRAFGGPLLLLRGDGVVGPVALALALEGGLSVVTAVGVADGTPAIALSKGWIATSANAGLWF